MGSGALLMRFPLVTSLIFLGLQWVFLNANFVQTRGTHFMANGSPLYVNGFNSYWLMYVATDPSQRYKVTSIFEQVEAHGLTVAQTWAFNDGRYKALQTSPGVYDEQVFPALDFVVSEAQKHGIILIDREASILSCRAWDGLNLGSLEISEQGKSIDFGLGPLQDLVSQLTMQRMGFWGTNLIAKDPVENIIFTVEGRACNLKRKRVLIDAAGNGLVTMKSKWP
eukprot:Gb_32194 [translate_table: standard]